MSPVPSRPACAELDKTDKGYSLYFGFGFKQYLPYNQRREGVNTRSSGILFREYYQADEHTGGYGQFAWLMDDLDIHPCADGDVRSDQKYGSLQMSGSSLFNPLNTDDLTQSDDTIMSVSWYALEQPAENAAYRRVVQGLPGTTDRARGITEADREVVFFDCLRADTQLTSHPEYTDLIFYIESQNGQDGERYRIKTAKVKSAFDHTNQLVSVDRADYGVEVAATSFKLTRMGNFVYAYWLATAQDDGKSDAYRLMGVTYDITADEMSNAMVLAEFTLADASLMPTDVFLSNDGRGYCTVASKSASNGAAANVYAFPFKWVTRLDISAVGLTETLVNPGDFVDVTVTVTNSGNTGISEFDLDMLLEGSGNDVTPVETVHCDCLESSNNTLSMNGETVTSGAAVLNRLDDAVDSMHPSTHVVARSGWTASAGDYTRDPQTLDNPHLMPGAVKCFVVPLKIPADWAGEKTFSLDLSRYSTNTLWTRASDSAANSLGDENQTITYEKTAKGVMTRMDNADAPFHAAQVPASDPLGLDYSIHDLDVDYRVYRDGDGAQYLSITFLDHADVSEMLSLYAEVYIDDAAEPVSVALPYMPNSTTHSRTHTLDLRLKDLFGDAMPRKARVVIRPENTEQLALRNDEFMLYFNDTEVNDPLVIVVQPRDVVALVGENVVFTVAVSGGVRPYTYQWQVFMNGKWQDIPGATSDTLEVASVTPEMNGRKARCVITDHNLNTIISDAATLTLRDAVVPTGDDSHLTLYLAIAAAALALLWYMRRRERRA